jgi:hypothetical protein
MEDNRPRRWIDIAKTKIRLAGKDKASPTDLLPERTDDSTAAVPKKVDAPFKDPNSNEQSGLSTRITVPVGSYGEECAGILQLPANLSIERENRPVAAAVFVAGIFNHLEGPSYIYEAVSHNLETISCRIASLRLNYRHPGKTQPCVEDIQAAMTYLDQNHGISQFVLIGWSFGGAPVFAVAAQDSKCSGVNMSQAPD